MAARRDIGSSLANGMVLKVQLEEVAELKAQVAEQGDALNALRRELADIRRDMARTVENQRTMGNLEERVGTREAEDELKEVTSKEAITEMLKASIKEMKGEMMREFKGEMKAELRGLREEMGELALESARCRREAVEAQQRAMADAKEWAGVKVEIVRQREAVEAQQQGAMADVKEQQQWARLMKQQVEAERKAERKATRDAVSALKTEMHGFKEETARLRVAVEAQRRVMAGAKEAAAHAEARISNVELGLAELKGRLDGKRRDERSEGSVEGHAEVEGREGKRRKRKGAGSGGEVAGAGGEGCGGIIASAHGKPDEEAVWERYWDDEEEEEEEEEEACIPGEDSEASESEVQELWRRVEVLEETRAEGTKTWEAIIKLWSKSQPAETHMELSGISSLSDAALTELSSMSCLTTINLRRSSGFTADGIRQLLLSLTGLTFLDLGGTGITDAALDGLASLKSLHTLNLGNTRITDAGMHKLQCLAALRALYIGKCTFVTSASMAHVGKLTALERLALHESGVREDGLQHLTTLTSLNFLILPPGVTDSSMKHLRNLKCLERLGLWDARITAGGVKWLQGLEELQMIGTEAEDVEMLVRDNFPGMIVTSGPLD